MKVTWNDIADLLVDPVDRSPLTIGDDRASLRSEAGQRYELLQGQPVLLPATSLTSGGWQFDRIVAVDPGRPKPIRRFRSLFGRFKRLLRRGSPSLGAAAKLIELMPRGDDATDSSRVLIVGGATVGHGSAPLVDAPHLEVISFDVYPTPATTFVADGHAIPLADASVSAVWIQAVLEHVYRPEVVVAEIVRVLRPGGIVYAETPFLQPVHEGAYDFARFSQSGHRMLFSQFDEVAAGSLGGPGALLTLAIRGLVGGVTRSAAMARIAYGLAQPMVLLDRLVPEPWRADFATGTYFLGRLSTERDRRFDAPSIYRGAG